MAWALGSEMGRVPNSVQLFRNWVSRTSKELLLLRSVTALSLFFREKFRVWNDFVLDIPYSCNFYFADSMTEGIFDTTYESKIAQENAVSLFLLGRPNHGDVACHIHDFERMFPLCCLCGLRCSFGVYVRMLISLVACQIKSSSMMCFCGNGERCSRLALLPFLRPEIQPSLSGCFACFLLFPSNPLADSLVL